MYDQILRAANQFGCKAIQYADMKHYTTFHIGGPADLVVEPNSVDSSWETTFPILNTPAAT